MLIGNETGAEKAQEANSPKKPRSRSGKGEGRGMASRSKGRWAGRDHCLGEPPLVLVNQVSACPLQTSVQSPNARLSPWIASP